MPKLTWCCMPAGVARPRRIMVSFWRFLALISPSGQRWQWRQSVAFWQLPGLKNQAQGWQLPAPCSTEPRLGVPGGRPRPGGSCSSAPLRPRATMAGTTPGGKEGGAVGGVTGGAVGGAIGGGVLGGSCGGLNGGTGASGRTSAAIGSVGFAVGGGGGGDVVGNVSTAAFSVGAGEICSRPSARSQAEMDMLSGLTAICAGSPSMK
mmetsp:Transcript_63088/g.162441  ORF Transcript_63088/g.162441 Transcript_63088/m.162441 type:complete len:206 (+) Transcript_63088:1000-1617(+)